MQPPKRTLRRSGIMLCLLIGFTALKAQKAVTFENIGFDEAIEKAKSQKKIVFVDVRGMNANPYNDKVDNEIFTLDSVADFFNDHCINIRINMNSDEGKKFAPRLNMLMYPVYVFHGTNGDQLDFVGAGAITKDPGILMEKARSALAIEKMKHSNTRTITFTKDSWASLLKKAKASNKLIFLDAYTAWCRPCIMMARDIFTLDKVADYYNDKFINVSMDMEKGEGPQVRKKYGVNAYPAFLYIDGNGKLVHEDGGYQEADRFIQNGKTAVDNKAAGKFYIPDTTKGGPKVIPFADAPMMNSIRPASGPAPAPGSSSASGTSSSSSMSPSSSSPDASSSVTRAALIIPAGAPDPSASSVPGSSASSALSAPASKPGMMTPAHSSSAIISPAGNGMFFTEGSWASLLAMAKQTGRLIFVDANTSWCGPCKEMRKDIFPLKEVSLLYNNNFINVDLDMEKGEGVEFRKKYGVKAYPTFLYIDGDGEVIHRTVGSCDGLAFRQHALDAMSPRRNLHFMQEHYKKDLQDEQFITAYLQALKDAYENDLADTVALSFLQQKDPVAWKQQLCWILTRDYVNDATSPVFRNLVKEQTTFSRMYNPEVVETKIYQTYMAWPQHYLSYPGKGKAKLDETGFNSFLGQVKESPYAKKDEIEARSKLTVYFGLKDWPRYTATVNDMLDKKIITMDDAKGAESLYICADYINRFASDDKQALAAASGWAKLFTTPGINGVSVLNKASYLDLYATLLEKTGRTDEALQVRKQINQDQLSNAKAGAPFQTLMRIQPHQP